MVQGVPCKCGVYMDADCACNSGSVYVRCVCMGRCVHSHGYVSSRKEGDSEDESRVQVVKVNVKPTLRHTILYI